VTVQPFAVPQVMGLLAATPVAGIALVNGTPVILSWTAPNDGKLHRVMVAAAILVAVTEVGGLVQLQWTGPGAGSAQSSPVFAAALLGGTAAQPGAGPSVMVAPGSTVSLVQGAALTVGAATVYAEFWGA
jgi:hypothetical protein